MTNIVSTAGVRREERQQSNKEKLPGKILIGKDILELVSGAMYLEPLTIIREYTQNAVDAIDEAEAIGLYSGKDKARIDIFIDLAGRKLRIRDNGVGVPNADFWKRLTAFGASKKRGTRARGFRGVGRLSGLGYCQELIFRSRSDGDSRVLELSWDGRKLKDILLDSQYRGDLNDVAREVTTVTTSPGAGQPKHFFEVELRGLARHENDILLNEHEIEAYLSQIAPVPFHPDFCFGAQIEDYLATFGIGRSYDIFIDTMVSENAERKQILRAYRNSFRLFGGKQDRFTGVELFELPGIDGGNAAVGWILDHGYYGAIPKNEGIRGMRLRLGNIQVGSDEIVAEVFPEPRFNSWMVGEIHVISPKLIPNGRRDAFESNSHFLNLQGYVAVHARTIAKTCRDKSKSRNFERRFEIEKDKINEKLKMVSRSSLPRALKKKLRREITVHIKALEKLVSLIGNGLQRKKFEQLLGRVKVRVGRNIDEIVQRDPLERFPKAKQVMYRQVIELIFESAPRNVAGPLVEKMLTRLSR